MKEHILENYPGKVTPANIAVIPNSVDTSQNYPEYRPTAEWTAKWQETYPELSGKYTLCLPGRITRLKGATHLAPILSELNKRGIPAHAVIVGETKKGKEAIRKEIEDTLAQSGQSGNVTWTGHRNDLRDILCSCDVTLSLTLQPESFGKTTLEALALGRPVAGYEHGGVGEQLSILLPEGKVPTGDISAMAGLLAQWYEKAPVPAPVTAPYRRQDMIDAHISAYNRQLLNA
jgi:glycosyltransferase involved in cell wall biosynthesis